MSKTQIPTGGIADDAISEEHIDATVITGSTALVATPATTDEFLINDGGTIKRLDASFIQNSSTAFGVKLSTDQSVSSASNTILQFASEDFDNGSNFDVSNYRFTCPEAGQYLFHARVYIEWGNAAGEIGRLQLVNGGTAVAIDAMTASGDPTSGSSIRITSILNCSASDNIDVRLYHNQGASQLADNDPDFTYFTGCKL